MIKKEMSLSAHFPYHTLPDPIAPHLAAPQQGLPRHLISGRTLPLPQMSYSFSLAVFMNG